VSFEDYDRNPLRLALDLASFGAGALSAGELVDRQRRMLTDHGYPGQLADLPARDVDRLRTLGREVDAVLGTAGQEPFARSLAALFAAQDCRPQLSLHDGAASPHLHYARDGAPLVTWLATMAVSGLVLHVCRDGRSRLRRCTAVGCGRWYADESRNGSRRYCSPACASRTTVASFRRRQAAAGAEGSPV
jgi:predicted RNA-binding Zn ribbon-like protein